MVDEDDDDAPEVITFDDGKRSAFAVFEHLHRSLQRDKETIKQKKRSMQERMMAERKQKEERVGFIY